MGDYNSDEWYKTAYYGGHPPTCACKECLLKKQKQAENDANIRSEVEWKSFIYRMKKKREKDNTLADTIINFFRKRKSEKEGKSK